MRRPISRTQHGLVDYAVAALEGVLARTLPASRRVQRLLALVKVLPMRAHLALDGVFAAAFLAAPLLGDEDDPASVRVALAVLGAVGAATALLTDPDRA
jgi:hypothetical protein